MERLVTMKGDSRKGEQGVDTGQVGITKTGRQEEKESKVWTLDRLV